MVRKTPSPNFSRSTKAARMNPKTIASALPTARIRRFFSEVVHASLPKSLVYWAAQPAGSMTYSGKRRLFVKDMKTVQPMEPIKQTTVTASAGISASRGTILLQRTNSAYSRLFIFERSFALFELYAYH